jgi:hypothetical protein
LFDGIERRMDEYVFGVRECVCSISEGLLGSSSSRSVTMTSGGEFGDVEEIWKRPGRSVEMRARRSWLFLGYGLMDDDGKGAMREDKERVEVLQRIKRSREEIV